jgi:hypothetical protein
LENGAPPRALRPGITVTSSDSGTSVAASCRRCASQAAGGMRSTAACAAAPAPGQGLTLVHFSAQPEPFLTQNTP